SYTFCGVEKTIVGGGIVGPEVIADNRWEQREHASPNKVHRNQSDGKPGSGYAAQREHGNQAERLKDIRYEHGHFAPDAIRDPAPEYASRAVGEATGGERCRECRGADLEGVRHRTALGGQHESTYGYQHKGDV